MDDNVRPISNQSRRDRDLIRMQFELAAMMRHQISWNDRIAFASTMAANRRAHEADLREMQHLFPDGGCETHPDSA